LEVLREVGLEPDVTEWERPAVDLTGQLFAPYVDFTRRRLCLPPDRTDEVAALVRRHPPEPRRSVVLSWAGGGA
ncbi:MAG: class I SAM-dependent methyltransferase, partial [Actinomycetes bacterium]